MPAPALLAGLPKPILFGLYGAIGGLLGALLIGEPVWYWLKPPEASLPPQMAVGASASVKLYPGTNSRFFVRIARERFDSAVAIAFPHLPPGISIPTSTIRAGETQIEVAVSAEANASLGTTKVSFEARAEGGTPTATSAIDVEVVPPPPALALAIPSSLAVYANGTGRFTASVARRGYDGPISLEIAPLPPGVTAARATIPAGKSDAEVVLSAASTATLGIAKLTVTASAETGSLDAFAGTELQVKRPPIAPVDIAFVLDVTASMQWALGDLKNGIGKFADALSQSQIDFRLGLVTFQDITNPGEKIEVVQFDGSPFTANPATFRNKVARLKAEGGGDIPESSLEGLAEAGQLPFRQGASRIILLITDAPPKVVPIGKTAQAVRAAVERVKSQGIDSVHLVVERFDLPTYRPLLEAGSTKGGGKSFDLGDVVRGDSGFDEILTSFGKAVAAEALARSADVKPEVAAPPDPPRVSAATEALKGSEAPPPPTIKGVQASGQFAAGSEGRLTLAIGAWTSAIAAMLCLALLSGQHHYLRGRFPPILRAMAAILGGAVVGFLGGAAGQGLYMLAPVAAFQILGWALLGGLAGCGLSLFIPNLKWLYGLIGGAIGGAMGGLSYIYITPQVGDVFGRLVGGLAVGFCIGLMVAIVEAAFRRAWLEVRYGARETIAVNLGPEPIKIGSDSRVCTVWARGAAPLALRFFIRNGEVICDDTVMKRESSVAEGFAKEVGNVTVTVRTGAAAQLVSRSGEASPTKPAPLPPLASTTRPPVIEDDFDGLPMPISPPPNTLPSGKATIPPASPLPASRAVPPAPALPRPPLLSKPPAPLSPPAARPPVPPVPPKPTASPPPLKPASAAKHPDACPSCGRVNAGKPKARYCMVCDQTY